MLADHVHGPLRLALDLEVSDPPAGLRVPALAKAHDRRGPSLGYSNPTARPRKWNSHPKVIPQGLAGQPRSQGSGAEYIDQERERRSAVQEGSLLHKYLHLGLSRQARIFTLPGPLGLLHEPPGGPEIGAAAILRQVP